MTIKLCEKEEFYVCGYFVETSLETCGPDIGKLWRDFKAKKAELYASCGAHDDFYGLMWKTQGDRYCYLIGVAADQSAAILKGATFKHIPRAKYAVAKVPASISAVDAWTEFYYKVLPEAGLTPNAAHGLDFEYYPCEDYNFYELWTPVINTNLLR